MAAIVKAERIKLLEEKRQWQVEMMLADLPPTPASESSSAVTQADVAPLPPVSAPARSPRKSPRKVRVGSPKKTRVSRRSSGIVSLSPRVKSKIIPAFETEVIPPPAPVFTTSLDASPFHPAALPPAFVLPPPSPAATIGNKDHLLAIPPISSLIPSNATDPNQPMASSSVPPTSSSDALPEITAQQSQSAGVPSTPLRPFPMAKPFAQRMIHAYSPAKPSPLSRILMMASPDSPDSATTPPLQVLTEEDESEMDVSPTPAGQVQQPAPVVRSLAAELGIASDSDDDEKAKKAKSRSKPSSKVTFAANRWLKSQTTAAARSSRSQPSTTLEKENKIQRSKPGLSTGLSSSKVISGGIVKKTAKPPPLKASATSLDAGVGVIGQTRIISKVKGGARRVPIESAQPVPTWKG